MAKNMSVEEFREILKKLDDKRIEKIFTDDIRIARYNGGKFDVVIGNLILAKVDLMTSEVAIHEKDKGFNRGRVTGIDVEVILYSNGDSTLTDDLRGAVGENPEEEEELEDLIVPDVDDEGNEEGIMQLAELFEEEEKDG